jgi:hypothetical protein
MSGAIHPLPQYAFMVWCLVKITGTTLHFTFTFMFASVSLCLTCLLEKNMHINTQESDSLMSIFCHNLCWWVSVIILNVAWSFHRLFLHRFYWTNCKYLSHDILTYLNLSDANKHVPNFSRYVVHLWVSKVYFLLPLMFSGLILDVLLTWNSTSVYPKFSGQSR